MYPVSNESCSDEPIKMLWSIKGIDRYIGICGGGTQNLHLLSMLKRNNNIKEVHLVDCNRMQLYNFSKIAKIYNHSKDDAEYRTLLEQHINEVKYLSNLEPNKKKPCFDNDVTITLHNNDITDHLKNVKDPGRYFIYLSNILYDPIWMSNATSRDLLNQINAETCSKEGSIIFSAQLVSYISLLEKKEFGLIHKIC